MVKLGEGGGMRMTGAAIPPPDAVAWRDSATRRALGWYALRTLGWLALTVGCSLVADTLVDENGDARSGVPEIVPFIPILGAIFGALLAVFCLLRLVQMTWCAVRHPWRTVEADLEELSMRTPNGQPVLFLTQGENRWTLTLGAIVWRWSRFDQQSLLLAARPRRGGMVATPDRRSIAWAGRSLFTAYKLWRARRRDAAPGRD